MNADLIRDEHAESIIRNAFQFLERKDLIIINKVITYPFLDKDDLENNSVYEMYLTRKPSDNKTYINISYKSEWESILEISSDDNKNLTDFFNEVYIYLTDKQQKRCSSFI